jgi:hypothetical protein
VSVDPRLRPTHTESLICKLREARAADQALGLSDIMRLGIAEASGHIDEIRERGFEVIHELESFRGIQQSRYYLLFDPELDGAE